MRIWQSHELGEPIDMPAPEETHAPYRIRALIDAFSSVMSTDGMWSTPGNEILGAFAAVWSS